MRSNILNAVLLALLIAGIIFLSLAIYDILGMYSVGADGS